MFVDMNDRYLGLASSLHYVKFDEHDYRNLTKPKVMSVVWFEVIFGVFSKQGTMTHKNWRRTYGFTE